MRPHKKKLLKTGPNSVVKEHNGLARKSLEGKRGSIRRFKKEVEILQAVAETDIDRVVPILDYNLSEKPYWYDMELFDGNLEEVVEDYKGDSLGAVRALLPIVRALRRLSEHNPPIYHRDLKPANILYKTGVTGRELWLTDFGCGLLYTTEAARHTDDFRAVGARQYRAPEYEHGRVDNVTEAGDVFSIGKILWHMVNGVPDEVFPYTLWFPPEYDLSLRFEDAHVSRLNLAIAGCVAFDSSLRPSYDALIEGLENLDKRELDPQEMSLRDKLARRDALLAIEDEQARGYARSLAQMFVRDLERALAVLDSECGDVDEVKRLLTIRMQDIDQAVASALDAGSGVLWAGSSRSLQVHASIYGDNPQFGSFHILMNVRSKRSDVSFKPAKAFVWTESGSTRQKVHMQGNETNSAYDRNTALELLRAGLAALVPDEQ